MPIISIVGAGTSGLLLAIHLRKAGYHVNVYSDRSPSEILQGRITSSQATFDRSLNYERELGLNFWEHQCSKNKLVSLNITNPQSNERQVSWCGNLDNYFQSVDQRLKFSAWMLEFERLGGKLIIKPIEYNDLIPISEDSDLTILATGKGKLGSIFKRDEQRSVFTSPMRQLSLLYVKNMIPAETQGVYANIIPGIGEYFTLPGLAVEGPCEMMLFEGIPNQAFDCWHDAKNPQDQLHIAKTLLEKHLPWEAERCKNIELLSNNSVLMGKFTPEVRHPTHQLENKKIVLGLGDAVILNDPISGQGANNATNAAHIYAESILKNTQNDFSIKWMHDTFETVWSETKDAVDWSNMLLLPPPEHVQKLFFTASQNQDLADRLANSFNDISVIFPWIKSPDGTQHTLGEYTPNILHSGNNNAETPTNTSYYNEKLQTENLKFIEAFKCSPLMQLINSSAIHQKTVQEKMLDAIQLFSNHFQNAVMLKYALTDAKAFKAIAEEHLAEEFLHNVDLSKDRDNREPLWDPILEATSSWFSLKMITADNREKILIMHMVLEASAHIFFCEAEKVMRAHNKTKYFSIHAVADEKHDNMGLHLLKNISSEDHLTLLHTQQQAWQILYTACNRIAELCRIQALITKEENILKANDSIRNNISTNKRSSKL